MENQDKKFTKAEVRDVIVLFLGSVLSIIIG